jgi:uncharacterized protein
MSVSAIQNFTPNETLLLAQLVTDRRLELILFPTEKCNFRCTYCYEDFAIGRMTRQTINSVKELIKRRAEGLDVLYLTWFGGEPLLALDIIMEISSYASELIREYPDLSHQGSMTTNAYRLDPSTFSALARVGVLSYQISLDGPRDIHNQTRVKADRGGSFDTIWQNLLAIRQTDFVAEIKLRIHFSADTVSKLDPLIDEIKEQFLPDPRFRVFFKAIGRWGGPNDDNIQLLPEQEEHAAISRLTEKLYGDKFGSMEKESHICYASRPNSLVIRADGRVGKCTAALNDSRNVIGKLRPDGTLALDQRRIQPWLRGLATMNADVLACPFVGLSPESSLPDLVRIQHSTEI